MTWFETRLSNSEAGYEPQKWSAASNEFLNVLNTPKRGPHSGIGRKIRAAVRNSVVCRTPFLRGPCSPNMLNMPIRLCVQCRPVERRKKGGKIFPWPCDVWRAPSLLKNTLVNRTYHLNWACVSRQLFCDDWFFNKSDYFMDERMYSVFQPASQTAPFVESRDNCFRGASVALVGPGPVSLFGGLSERRDRSERIGDVVTKLSHRFVGDCDAVWQRDWLGINRVHVVHHRRLYTPTQTHTRTRRCTTIPTRFFLLCRTDFSWHFPDFSKCLIFFMIDINTPIVCA